MSDELCTICRTHVPFNGYVCEFCVHDELRRIRKLPQEQVRGRGTSCEAA